MTKPLMFDLCCGLGGATEGFLTEGWECIGVDIEQHVYGHYRYPAQLWVQDLLTIHGSQLRHARFLWASVPCQEFSYMAMPWSRGKQIARALRGEDEFPESYNGSRSVAELTALFDACFRIQREACEAAGRHIPMIVENVRGAQPWVGKAPWMFGSFALWGDVPALMPVTLRRSVMKQGCAHRSNGETNFHGDKSQGMNWSDASKRGQNFTRIAGKQAVNVACPNTTMAEGRGVKGDGSGWRENGTLVSNNRMVYDGRKSSKGGTWFGDYAAMKDGVKQGGDWFSADQPSISRMSSSKSPRRKFASAMIAKIPLVLSRHIARAYSNPMCAR